MLPGLLHDANESPRPILIRPATPDDAVAIWLILKAAVRTLIGRVYTSTQVESWIADEDPAKFPGSCPREQIVLVAESACGIIGFARVRGDELEALYVHPAHRRNSVGALLLDTLEKAASRRKVKTLFLDAALNAVRFYQSAGYHSLGPSMPLFDNGIALPCVRMEKSLTGSRGWRNSKAAHYCHRGEPPIIRKGRPSKSNSISGFFRVLCSSENT